MFVLLLASIVNQQCMIQPTLNNLHPNEYSLGLHYFLSS